MGNKQFLTRDNSKSVIERYNLTKNEQTIFPDFDLVTASELVYSDPVVNGAQQLFVDKCMEGGP